MQAVPAVETDAVAIGDPGTATLSYHVAELSQDYQSTKTVVVQNFGNVPLTFDIGTAHDAGSPHSVVTAPSVTVPAHGTVKVPVQLVVPAATAGDSSAFRDVAGLVTFTPESGANHGVSLSVPYYLVARATSSIKTTLQTQEAPQDRLGAGHHDQHQRRRDRQRPTGTSGGCRRPRTPRRTRSTSVPSGAKADGTNISFAVSTYGRWTSAAANEFDIGVDVNGDGVDDYVVFAADQGRRAVRERERRDGRRSPTAWSPGAGYILSLHRCTVQRRHLGHGDPDGRTSACRARPA